MNDQLKKTNMLVIILASALVGLLAIAGAAVFVMTGAVTEIKDEITEIRAGVEEAAQYQRSPKQFRRAVADSLEQLALKKQKELLDAQYAQYNLAADKVPDDKSIYGNVNARFTLVEFSDTECPFCKRFHETAKQLVDNSKNNVNWQWKHLPLGFHNPAAKRQAMAAECVREQKGNKGFWVFIDQVFQQSPGNGQGISDLVSLVQDVGADVKQVQECMKENRYVDKIDGDTLEATNNGITGTPATFVVDNTTGKYQLLSGAQPAQAIMATIRKMLAEQEEAESATGFTVE